MVIMETSHLLRIWVLTYALLCCLRARDLLKTSSIKNGTSLTMKPFGGCKPGSKDVYPYDAISTGGFEKQ